MRISDWSSDVCSSDLFHLADRTDTGSIIGKSRIAIARDTLGLAITLRKHGAGVFGRGARPAAIITNEGQRDLNTEQLRGMQDELAKYSRPENAGRSLILPRNMKYQSVGLSNEDVQWLAAQQRSAEHTSELQSLMRISYAVFCLKKKTNLQKNK